MLSDRQHDDTLVACPTTTADARAVGGRLHASCAAAGCRFVEDQRVCERGA